MNDSNREIDMDDSDIIDALNGLLKLGVGDPYRLEHIKQAYIQNARPAIMRFAKPPS